MPGDQEIRDITMETREFRGPTGPAHADRRPIFFPNVLKSSLLMYVAHV